MAKTYHKAEEYLSPVLLAALLPYALANSTHRLRFYASYRKNSAVPRSLYEQAVVELVQAGCPLPVRLVFTRPAARRGRPPTFVRDRGVLMLREQLSPFYVALDTGMSLRTVLRWRDMV